MTSSNKKKYIIRRILTFDLDGGWIILVLLPFIFPPFIYLRTGQCEDVLWAIQLGVIIVAPFVLLSLLPKFNYFLLNRKDVASFDFVKNIFTFSHGDMLVKFNYDDIDSVILHTGIKSANTAYLRLPWEDYTHVLFKLRNGKCFILSSLIYPEIDVYAFANKLRICKSFYRSGFGLKHNI